MDHECIKKRGGASQMTCKKRASEGTLPWGGKKGVEKKGRIANKYWGKRGRHGGGNSYL